MSDLKPLGSEKLSGQEQINRILEMANYGSKPSTISENKSSTSEYSIQLADGKHYGIVKEKTGYIIKKGINESELDYAEPMQNRKHYRSFSQAMKKINLIAGELNRLFENVEGVNIIGEQKKFVLKTPKPEVDVELDIEEPLGEPSVDLDLGSDLPDTQLDDESMDLDMDLDMDTETSIEDEELDLDIEDTIDGEEDDESSFKVIQKLTGKIGQKLRTYDKNQGLSSEDIKYVTNSIISAVSLEKLSEEDKEDILANFEEEDVDYGMDDTDIDIDAEDEDLDLDLDLEEPIVDDELSEQDSMTSFVDEIFTESKVDKVLKKYFVINENEKSTIKSKNIKKFLSEKVKNISVKKEIKRLSKTVEQELTSEFLVKENNNIIFLGKTNKGNLVFESEGKQLKVSTKGVLI